MVLAKTVPLTEADPLVALNVALAVVPGDAQGVPETPLQLVAEVSQVAPLAPVQVPLVCAEAVAASASSAVMASDRAAGSQVAPTPEATNWDFDFMVVGNFYLISGGKYFVPPQDSTDAQQEIPMKFLQFVYMATCPSPSREVAAASL
jgi:hypothetical protein